MHHGDQSSKPVDSSSEAEPSVKPQPAASRDSSEASTHQDTAQIGRRWSLGAIKLTEWIMIAFTAVTAMAAWAAVYEANEQRKAMDGQLFEMHTGGLDTHNLAVAAHDQAIATEKLRLSGEDEAEAMERLRKAGEAQAIAADKLRLAGEAQSKSTAAQAKSTQALADNSGKQIPALLEAASAARVQAESARVQADAITKSSEAAIAASKATDKLAASGQAQADAVLQSLATAKEANAITAGASDAANRPWVEMTMPAQGHPAAAQDFTVEVAEHNTGHSPALSVTVNIEMSIFTVGPNLTIGTLSRCSANCQVSTIFPTNQGFGIQGFAYHPTIDKERLTAGEMKKIAQFKDAIILRTRVDYSDSHGTEHTTVSCSFYSPKLNGSGAFTSCLIGNWAT